MTTQRIKPPRGQNAAGCLILIAWTLLAVWFMSACSPRVIENIRYQRDTTYIEKVRVDSVYKKDSVYLREKGDTVFLYKEKIRERYRFIHDTVRLVKVDSFAVDRIVTVKVEKPLSAAQSAKIGAFWWLIAAVLLLGGWTFRKQLIPILKSILKI